MYRIGRWVLASVAVLMLGAIPTQEAELAWIENADASHMFKADASRKHYRFFVVCGFACNVVGVGSLNADRCFPNVVVETIKGTTDMGVSSKHTRLVGQAYEFSAQYNRLVAEHLRAQGLASCRPSADWDRALNDMTNYVWSLSGDRYPRGYVAAPEDPRASGYTFAVELPSDASIDAAILKLCAVARKNGIDEAVHLRVGKLGRSEARAVVACSGALR